MKMPLRICIVTRERKPQNELLRIVFNSKSDLVMPNNKKRFGRGIYIIPTQEVFETALKKGSIERALKIGRALKLEEIEAISTALIL
jgi:predicted RNA-binding protein YlxR (DUF448 family)